MDSQRPFDAVVERDVVSAEVAALQDLTADLFTSVVDVMPHEVERAIRHALQRLLKLLNLDRCTLLRFDDLESTIVITPGDATPVAAERAGVPWRVNNRPWSIPLIKRGELVTYSSADEIPNDIERDHLLRHGPRSGLACPVTIGGQVAAALCLASHQDGRRWPPHLHDSARLLSKVIGAALARTRKDTPSDERIHLQRSHEDILQASVVAHSRVMRQVLRVAEQVARTDSTVLLLGETGSGKEIIARYIHDHSARRQRTMVRVNCAAIPATLIESELFGRERGAFTGATTRQAGRFELADRSTIFLDEIGDLAHDVQVKLLRVLEEREFERLGSSTTTQIDTRVIAATHRNLEERIAEGSFREDLFYRLNVFPIHVPPLRERVEDLPPLVAMLVEQFSSESGLRFAAISEENMAALQQYPWPGNIRELRNVVERAMILATGSVLRIPVPDTAAAGPQTQITTRLIDVERAHIHRVLESTAWRIRGTGGAADQLGLPPTTLEARMSRLGLVRRPQLE